MRGQAATEMLMTYGWAIILALVMVAVFSYLVFFNPQVSAPKSCMLSSQLTCTDWELDANGNLFLDLGQATGDTITVTGIGCSNSTNPSIVSISPVMIPNGGHAFITNASGIPCIGARPPVFRGTLILSYNSSQSSFPKQVKGDISSPITGTGTAFTVISACPFNVTTNGSYLLESSLTADAMCIYITENASGAIIDCQGNTITGSNTECPVFVDSTQGTGILLWGARKITVRNCIFANFYDGIALYLSHGNTISGNTANNNYCGGIRIHMSDNNTISGNTADYNFNRHGILMYSSNNNTFSGNVARWNAQHGFVASGYGVTVKSVLSNNNFCDNNDTNYDISCTDDQTNQIDSGGNACGAQETCNVTCSAC